MKYAYIVHGLYSENNVNFYVRENDVNCRDKLNSNGTFTIVACTDINRWLNCPNFDLYDNLQRLTEEKNVTLFSEYNPTLTQPLNLP